MTPKPTLDLAPTRRRLFTLLAVVLPVAAILLLEAGLRLAGFGTSHPLFVPVSADPEFLRVNRDAVLRFVVDDKQPPKLWIRPVYFRRHKSEKTFRIFVQGGSTAEGYPYGYGASPAAMLRQRLQRTFPDRDIEVITTAMSAVGSYTLLDFSKEIIAQSPDAVVIYAGHNEYVGLLGVGSGISLGRRRPVVLAFLGLKESRIVQLLKRGIASLGTQPARDDQRTLMATLVAAKRIAFGSPLYERGLTQYRANLRALLRRYRKAGVPVFIGTVVSNEGDQPPFLSGHGPGVDTAAWRRHAEAGQAALAAGDAAAARAAFATAVALDDAHAEGHFGLGRALRALGRYAEARRSFRAAKDRDELRFRAPEAINQILRQVAAEQGAHVVDVQAALGRHARHGIVGHELMLEHLHPNLRGYFLLADAFYRTLQQQALIGSWLRPVSAQQAWQEIPVTEVDRLYGEYRIGYLTSDWPFVATKQRFELGPADGPIVEIAQHYFQGRLAWPDAMRELLARYRASGETAAAATVAVLLAEAFPNLAADQRNAAQALDLAGRPGAEIFQRRADAPP